MAFGIGLSNALNPMETFWETTHTRAKTESVSNGTFKQSIPSIAVGSQKPLAKRVAANGIDTPTLGHKARIDNSFRGRELPGLLNASQLSLLESVHEPDSRPKSFNFDGNSIVSADSDGEPILLEAEENKFGRFIEMTRIDPPMRRNHTVNNMADYIYTPISRPSISPQHTHSSMGLPSTLTSTTDTNNQSSFQLPMRILTPTGLSVIYQPACDCNVAADIIFVHGLFGHTEHTWTFNGPQAPISKSDIWSLYGLASKVDDLGHKPSPKAPKIFWPEKLLPVSFPNSRMFTWGFQSDIKMFFDSSDDKNTLDYLANRLLEDVLDHNWRGRCSERPIVFLAHSLGGLIVKKALLQSNAGSPLRNIRELRDATTAVLFLGTPHHGYEPDRPMLDIVTKIMNANGQPTPRSTMKLLAEQLKEIDFDEMHQRFRNMVAIQRRKGSDINIHNFLENKGMPLFGNWRIWGHIVPAGAASDEKDFNKSYIEKDHVGLPRFEHSLDAGYLVIRDVIMMSINRGPMRIMNPG
ncbi:alpha/beta-Hydrolase [Glarea lozoyensis ATCC 20868]|uniref:Alpha/beta-Hydrolase n=1 Tax=Glarea lozoyensis (strain ATCC 20868 / MF5171) TaxID=1116229 RepID=S3DMM8_GLAL2|nr:alpha/beta-Hydrolase [Glarea lozoyensis ATCC 20868]EPE33326.1 alpha/beta-Hydrolase [Glarea lozoyensis ATCC 20868]